MGDKGDYRLDPGIARFKHLFLERLEAIESLARSFGAGDPEDDRDQFASMISACDVQQRRYIVEKLEAVVGRLEGWRDRFSEALEGDGIEGV